MGNKAIKSEQQLVEGLESYLEYGYIDPFYINCHSFDENADQAEEYLRYLSSINIELVETYYKRIIESEAIWNDFFKSRCIYRLLFSVSERGYAFNYLNENSANLSIPILKEALSYFFYAKNYYEARLVPEGLLKKLQARYEEVKDEHDAKFYHLDEEYNNFVKAYCLS